VTILALHLYVPAEQHVLGISIVVERGEFPALLVVAGAAPLTKHPVMDVFPSVAGVTGCRRLVFVEVEMAFVTALARKAFVFVSQRVFGLTVVIEDDLFPTLVGMTGFTSLTESPFVGIILLMTGVAIDRSRAIPLVTVTVFATCEDMSPSQTELRLVMIETVEVHPFLFRVAGLALRRERSLRRLPQGFVVNVLVAGGAEISNRLVSHRDPGAVGEVSSFRAMTVGAENLCVPSAEREPRVPVVREPKVLGVEAVRGVAGFAVRVELAVMNVEMTALARGLERPVAHGGRHPVREQGALLRAVAFGAGDGFVTPGQRVSALSMFEAEFLEAFHPVAARAVVFELPEVRVLAVAVGALPEGDAPETLSGMASGASEPFMFSQQGESRGPMVELRLAPRRLRVAPLAIDSQARSMRVLVAVGATGEPKALPLLIGMALLALDLPVGARQAEAGAIVIESAFAERNVDGVALVAVRSEPSPMHVFVAGDAALVVQQKRCGLRARRSVRGSVTGVAARYPEMKSFERIARLPVIEIVGIPAD
jgi:hypothetical protein